MHVLAVAGDHHHHHQGRSKGEAGRPGGQWEVCHVACMLEEVR